MKWRIGIAAALTAALAAPLLAASPASAGSGVGCTSGSCSISLSALIKVNGDTIPHGGTRGGVNFVPPCLWNPIGDATTGSQAIIQEWAPDPPSTYGVDKSYAQAQKLVKKPKPGEWYILPVNPNASPAGKAACLRLPLYDFVPPGQTPPAPPIPARIIAKYAFARMRFPKPQITISPAGKGYVNLATFVWGNWPQSTIRAAQQQHALEAIATIRATGQRASVWAHFQGFTISAGGRGKVYDQQCGPTGSAYPLGNAPSSAGAGTPPDCGVLWQGPDANATVRVTLNWTVTWGNGVLNGPNGAAGHSLGPIHRTSTMQVPVSEIQSING